MVRTASLIVAAALSLGACQNEPTKDEVEANKNTFECKLGDDMLVLRFDAKLHEVRILMPDGNMMALHQIPTASGVRFSNGTYELTGKGTELKLSREGTATDLLGCANPPLPKKS